MSRKERETGPAYLTFRDRPEEQIPCSPGDMVVLFGQFHEGWI